MNDRQSATRAEPKTPMPESAPPGGAAIGRPPWRSPSVLALLAANLLPVAGVLLWGWSVYSLMVLFWLENIIVGVLSAARMLFVQPAQAGLRFAKFGMVPLFCVHYGIFTAVHGVFVFSLFGERRGGSGSEAEPDASRVLAAIDELGLALPVAALAASHLFSFAWNYLWRGEYRRANLAQLMIAPYGRVVVLHLVILFGGIAAQALGSPLWALLLLIVLKVGIDLAAHVREHWKAALAGVPEPSAGPTATKPDA